MTTPPRPALADFQAAFWRELWAEPGGENPADQSTAVTAQPGFAVYRNTALRGCVDALLSLYPSVLRLTGEDWLRGVARDFARANPPAHGELLRYGDGFPAFLAQTLPAGELPWLMDVAWMDRLWRDSHVGADAPALTIAALTGGDAQELSRSHLRPHPAARWRWCGDWPAFSLWHAARTNAADPNPPHWRGEGVLLTRPADTVISCEIDEAACALLDACARGAALGDALAIVHARFDSFDPGATLGHLLNQGAFAGAEETPCPC